MDWTITFYNRKLERLLLTWPGSLRAKLVRIFELIRQEGADLGLPLTRAMGHGLFEIRVKGQGNIG